MPAVQYVIFPTELKWIEISAQIFTNDRNPYDALSLISVGSISIARFKK